VSFPYFIGGNGIGEGANTFTAAVPGGALIGDLVLVMVQDYSGGGPSPIPAGFTLVNAPGYTNPFTWNGYWVDSLYCKFYDPADGAYGFGEGAYHAAVALWYRGCDPTTPFLIGFNSFSTVAATSYTPPAVGGIPVANELYVGFAGNSVGAILTNASLSIRENDSYPNNYNNLSSGDANANTRIITPTWFGPSSNSNWGAHGLILQPPPPVGGADLLPFATAADQITMRVENELEIILRLCQTLAGPNDLPGKNAIMKANLILLSTAIQEWTAALTTQIATL
jgi:hypothetical protein